MVTNAMSATTGSKSFITCLRGLKVSIVGGVLFSLRISAFLCVSAVNRLSAHFTAEAQRNAEIRREEIRIKTQTYRVTIMKSKILIVEDEPAMVDGLRDNFEYEGYEVI